MTLCEQAFFVFNALGVPPEFTAVHSEEFTGPILMSGLTEGVEAFLSRRQTGLWDDKAVGADRLAELTYC